MFQNIRFDKTFWAATIILIALFGLGYIQFLLIRKNLNISMEKLDQQVAQTLAYSGDEIYTRTPLSNLIYAIIREDTVSFPVGLDSLKAAGAQFYGMYLADRFSRAGIGAEFQFAVIDRITGEVYMKSDAFLEVYQGLGNYKIPLEGYIARECSCAPYLNLRLENVNEYLWRGLRWNLVLAFIFLLLLAIGLYFLIRLVNEQRFLNRTKNEFINHLTHEIKTPLFASRLSLKLLQEKSTPDMLPYIQAAREKNEFVAANVEKILELASLEDPEQILELKEISLSEVFSEVLKQFDDHTLERLQFSKDACEQKVRADTYHLKNALLNIIDNALKYSDADQEVEVTCRVDNACVRISVKDKGIGIDSSQHDPIFRKFYRVNATRVGGFGLGLSYARQVITMMGGSISVESEPGIGSTFTIELPLQG